MALDLGGQLQQRGVVELLFTAYRHGAGGDDARTDGGRGRPQATAVRDAVGADDFQAARLSAEQLEGGAHRPYEQMALVAREGVGALTCDVDMQSGVGDAHHDIVVQAQGKTQGIEAGTEIGAGSGGAHPDGGGAERGTGHRSMTLLD